MQTKTYHEVYGSGIPLLLGFPIMASHAQIFGEAAAMTKQAFLDGLTDRYRVLVADFPSIGKSDDIPPAELTAQRVCDEWLAVADAAGFDRFALWAYSWGAAAALQLATRTDRLTALAIGGWPPLGAPYRTILAASRANRANPPASSIVVLRDAAQYAQWATFYESIAGWSEADGIARIACPRMVYFGELGDTDSGGTFLLPIASILRERRGELEALGWRVVEIPGKGHEVGLEAAIVTPIVRRFLDDTFFTTEGPT